VNVLIFDPQQAKSCLLRSALVANGHRISISSKDADAIPKLNSALFDTVICVGDHFSKDLTNSLAEEMIHLPLILVGHNQNPEQFDRVHAILPPPFESTSPGLHSSKY